MIKIALFLHAFKGLIRPGLNFINIKLTNFLYKCCFGSFYYIHVTRKKLPKWRSYKIFVRLTLMKLTPGGTSMKRIPGTLVFRNTPVEKHWCNLIFESNPKRVFGVTLNVWVVCCRVAKSTGIHFPTLLGIAAP